MYSYAFLSIGKETKWINDDHSTQHRMSGAGRVSLSRLREFVVMSKISNQHI
jgi:hypothetical protein